MQEQLQEIDEKTSCHEDRVFFHSFAAQERLETLAKGRVEKEAQPARGGPRRQLTKSKNVSTFFNLKVQMNCEEFLCRLLRGVRRGSGIERHTGGAQGGRRARRL